MYSSKVFIEFTAMLLCHLFCISLQFTRAYALSESGSGKNKPVVTQLNAKWPHTPLLLEAAEYMSEESPAIFWTFVDDIASWDAQQYIQSE